MHNVPLFHPDMFITRFRYVYSFVQYLGSSFVPYLCTHAFALSSPFPEDKRTAVTNASFISTVTNGGRLTSKFKYVGLIGAR